MYAGISASLLRGLLLNISSYLYSDLGDPLLATTVLAWNAQHVPLSAAWWNFPSFAPLTGVTAFTEHFLLAYPVSSPIIWLTGNPVLAYNVVFLLAAPLNGTAAFALARELTGSRVAAFVAGLAYAFAPYQATHLSHIQMMLSFGMPIALLWLHRYATTGAPRALFWFAVGWLLTALANAYLLVFFPLLAILWYGWFQREGGWRRLGAAAVAALAGLVPIIPLLWGYHMRQGAYGLARSVVDLRAMGAEMIDVTRMYHHAAAWRGVLPHEFDESTLFPGFTIIALAGVAVTAAVRQHRAERQSQDIGKGSWPARVFVVGALLALVVLARVWAGPWGWHIGPLPLPGFTPYRVLTIAFVILLGAAVSSQIAHRAWARRDPVVLLAAATGLLWLLSLGPVPEWSPGLQMLATGPYRLLMLLPAVDAIRVPARAWLPAVLCLAALAGFGTRELLRRYPAAATAIVVSLSLMMVAEGWYEADTVQVPRPMRTGTVPRDALVLDLPIEEGFPNAVPQFRAVMGRYRTINGYSGYEPAHFNPLRHAIADVRPGALDSYRSTEDLYVVIRPGVQQGVRDWIRTLPGASHVFDVDNAEIIRLPRLFAQTP